MKQSGNRLRKIRKDSGMSQAKFASLIGISQTFLSDLENNNSAMSEVVLNSIEYKTGINKEWIKNGKGGKFLYSTSSGTEGGIAESDQDADLQNVIIALQKIPVKYRSEISKNVIAHIELLCKVIKGT